MVVGLPEPEGEVLGARVRVGVMVRWWSGYPSPRVRC